MTDKVSIIIPVYNCERYLTQAIESALNQTWKETEVIVVNDGSTDGTQDIIDDYHKKNLDNFRSFQRMDNRGISAALNSGINMSNADWIHWLSADDILYPTAVETMLQEIVNYEPHRTNAIFYSNYDIIDENDFKIEQFIEPDRSNLDHQEKINQLWQYFYGNGSSTMIHKKVFQKCGLFDESLRFGEDYEFWLRASALFNVQLIGVPYKTLQYRSHPEQLTRKVGGGNDEKIKAGIRAKMSNGI